jgi:hypothetical protein
MLEASRNCSQVLGKFAWSPTAPQTLSYLWRIYGAINHFSSSHMSSDPDVTNSAMPSFFNKSLREGHAIDPDLNPIHDPDMATWTRHNQGGENTDLLDPGSMFDFLHNSTQLDGSLAWLFELSMDPFSIDAEIPESCSNK